MMLRVSRPADNGQRSGLGPRAGRAVRQARREGGLRGRGPDQQRGDGATDSGRGAGRRGQGVHGERGRERRDRRAGREGGTGPGPGRRAHQQRGRHRWSHVLGRRGPHDRVHRQHQPARALLGEFCGKKKKKNSRTRSKIQSFCRLKPWMVDDFQR